jgi:hypothetical protein
MEKLPHSEMRLLLSISILCINCSITDGQDRPDPRELELRLSVHSRLFRMHDYSTPLTERKPDDRGIVEFTADFINDYAVTWPSLSPREAALNELASWVQRKGAMVTARAEGQRSAFTPRRSFIYSDWDFRVLNVFQNDSPVAAPVGGLITVARPGGSVTQNGIRYITYDKTFPDFQLGSTYILFLTELPESHSFQAFSGGSFVVSGSAVSVLGDYQSPSKIPEYLRSISTREFEAAIGSAISATRRKP